MINRQTVHPLVILAMTTSCLAVAPLTSALAQADIPFTYEIIDSDPPLHSHCKTVGDIDGDGFPDVLVGSARNGNGFFWYHYPDWDKYTIVPPGTGFTTDMQVGDVDGDGDLDAIIPKGYDKGTSVWWYENPRPAGDPASAAWTEHFIGTAGAHDLEVGDINNDGKLDVVARDGETTVFIQNHPNSWTANEVNTRSIEGTSLGDIDRDGDLDIAINGYWLENPLPIGDPATDEWTEYTIIANWPGYAGVLVVDLNEDGRNDVVLAPSETTGRLAWFEAPLDPRGNGWVEHLIEANAEYLHTFKAADMDLDGDLDLVTAEMLQSDDPDNVCVYRNNGGAMSWSKQVIATTGSHNLRVADIGSDGDMDVVGINWQGTTPLEMWHNELNPAQTLDSWERHVIDPDKPARAVFIKAGDLSGDGLPDIVTGGWWYQNPGNASGSWVRRDLGEPLNNMAGIYDFDSDGRLDVLGTEGVGSNPNPNFVWARNNGSGSFTILDNIEAGSGDFLQGVAIAQFQNGDPTEVALSWHAGPGGVQRLTIPADPVNQIWNWSQISATTQNEDLSSGDIDRDGDLDLLLGTKWLRNDGTSWSTHNLSSTSSIPDRNRLADVNGDGKLDAVVGFEFESKLSWYEQGPTPTEAWTEHSISTTFNSPMSLDVADLDHDGDVDVVVGEHDLSNPTTSFLSIFENEGGGESWIPHTVHTGDEHHDGTQLIDIDADGDLDIISIGWTHGRVLLYENLSTSGGGPSNQTPVAGFLASPSSGQAPLTVHFDASQSYDPDGDTLSYMWDFGDGTTGTGPFASHTYTHDGTFTIILTVSDGLLSDTAMRTVNVSSQPPSEDPIAHWPLDELSGTTAGDLAGENDGVLVGGPVWLPTGGRVGGALEFDGADDRVHIDGFDITGGSGMTIALWARVDAFNIPDARFISKAIGIQNDHHYWMVSTIVNDALRFRLKLGTQTITLSSEPGQVILGEWLHVTATYDGTMMRIYKDGIVIASTPAIGSIAIDPSASVELGNQPEDCPPQIPPGDCAPRPLRGVLDEVLIYNRALTSAEILVLANPGGNQAPSAQFTANPTSGQVPLAVAFDASASSDPESDPLTFSWDFGDGNSGNGSSPSHTFTAAGNYTVTLTVSDGDLSATATTTIMVTDEPPQNNPPIARFTATPQEGAPPLTVSFDAADSGDPDGDTLTYAWDFGDGTSAVGRLTSHIYSQIGGYEASLTVSDGELTHTATTTIIVQNNTLPLSLLLSVTQNQLITQHIEVFLAASQPLDASTLDVTIGSDQMVMELVDVDANMWHGEFELASSGTLSIIACATSLSGSTACSSDSLTTHFFADGQGGVVSSPDEIFALRIPAGSLGEDIYVVVMEADLASLNTNEDVALPPNMTTEDIALLTYSVGPQGLIVDGMSVEFRTTQIELPDGATLDQLYIEQIGIAPFASYFDEVTGIIRASAYELGDYALKIGTAGSNVVVDRRFARLYQNIPNPFNPTTTIPFELQTDQHVTVSIFDGSGRFVVQLLESVMPAGIGQIMWDGRSHLGQSVGSGVYFVRLETPYAADSRKILLVR